MHRFPAVALFLALCLLGACCGPSPRQVCCPPPPCPRPLCTQPPARRIGRAAPVAVIEEVAPAPTSAETPGAADRPDAAALAESSTMDMRVRLGKRRVKGLHWEETSLDVAATYLRTITGVDFEISSKARDAGDESDGINLQVDDVAVDTLLDLLVELLGLRWEARGNRVHILAREESGGALQVRFYDLKDRSPAPAEVTLARPDEMPTPEEDAATAIEDARVVAQIKAAVFPAYWGTDGVALESRNSILIVRASEAVLDAIDAWLDERRLALEVVRLPVEMDKLVDDLSVSLSIEESTIAETIDILKVQTGLNLVIDARAEAFPDKLVVDLVLERVPLLQVLRLVAQAAGEDAVWLGRANVLNLTLEAYASE